MGSVLVCVELGVGPKYEPNEFGGVGKKRKHVMLDGGKRKGKHEKERKTASCWQKKLFSSGPFVCGILSSIGVAPTWEPSKPRVIGAEKTLGRKHPFK
jgi:hypothetical protein